MENKKIVAAFVLIGISGFLYLNTEWPMSSVLQAICWIMKLTGVSILLIHLKSPLGKIATGLWLASLVTGLLQWLEINFLQLDYWLNPMDNHAPGGVICGDWSEWANVLLPFASYVCFLFYKPFSRLRAGWILLLVVSPLAYYFWDFIHLGGFFIRWGWMAYSIVYLFFILQLFPLHSKERRRTFAFLWLFIGFIYSLNILLNNDLKTIFVSMAGTIVWLIGVFLLRSTGYKKKGSGAFIAYGLLMLFSLGTHLLLSFLPALLEDIVAFILQLPAYICAAVGFARFAKSDTFGTRKCGMRTMSGILVAACILAIVFLIPVIGEKIASWSFTLLLFPIILIAWKNAFTTYPANKTENTYKIPDLQTKEISLPPQPTPAPVDLHLSESEKREQKLRGMSEEELREIIRQRTCYSPDMREAAEQELRRRRK